MISLLPTIPLWGLTALSSAGVVVAGGIALIAEYRRRHVQHQFDQIDGEQKLHEVKRIEGELETKRRQLGEIGKQHAEAKQLLSDTDRLRSEIAELEKIKDSLIPLKQEHDSLRQNIESLRGEKQAITSQVDRAQTALAEAKTQASVAEGAATAAQVRQQEAENQHSTIQAALASAREALQPVQDDLNTKRSELRDIERRARDAQSLIDRAEEAKEKVAALEEIEKELKIEQDNLGTVKSELDDARKRLEDAREEHTLIIARIEAKEAELVKRRGETGKDIDASILQNRIADVWKPVLPKISGSVGNTQEDGCLDRVQAYLRDHSLVFHERTVYAFHTALKVAEEAPLLVLAGISGTGKSLLPQRYAEAMGINFLPVPVQPRWDGPQDLLGFYNFLQEKFVATDFLRAIVQMHPYPDEWTRDGILNEESEYVSLKDQMLLVLLDEMNLARVEYYFSEFLSRLEIRRTIDESDERKRRMASIPIDAGPLPSRLRPPLVYPGPNTLFVGTINEDESKQSLSDMVVDRANVMRFARPKAPAPADAGKTPSRPEGRLALATWKSWRKSGNMSSSDRDRIESVTQELNDALAEIGRPFGFRLAQAMLTYADMYPSHAPDRVNRAIADQIEMRILPKLRGIELDDRGVRALDQIQTILEKTNDKELCEAVELANDQEVGRFHWLGVSREA